MRKYEENIGKHYLRRGDKAALSPSLHPMIQKWLSSLRPGNCENTWKITEKQQSNREQLSSLQSQLAGTSIPIMRSARMMSKKAKNSA